MSKNQGWEDRPKVHSYTARSRSPTVIADGFRQKKGSSKSMSSTWSHVSQKDRSETQEPYFSKYQHPVSPDSNTEADFQDGDEIIITLAYHDHNNQQHFVDIRRACTVEEYMQWMFILHSAVLLDQFNVNLKKELDISLVLTSESVMHVGRTNQNVEYVVQTCNQIVEIELKSLGKKLGLMKTDLHPDEIERYNVELGISAQAKALKGHVYFVFMKGDHKKVAEYIEKLENCRREEEMIDKQIVTQRIWIKVAKMINLNQILTGHCKCMDLNATFHPRKENCIVSLTGPRRAVELAAIEFNNINQRLLHQKCELSVTSKTALSELHMESFLDELLLNNGIRCVTEQRKDKIFVYGLSEDCIKKAKKEVEAVIIEKTSTIQGQLKQKKQLLISCLKSRHPKEIVIHVEDSGFLHIIGLKAFVIETCQRLNDIKEGRIKLEEIDSGEKYGTKIEDVVAMSLSDGQIEQKLTVNDDRVLSKVTPNYSLNDSFYTHHCEVDGKKEGEIVKMQLTTGQDIACKNGKGEVSQVQEVMDNVKDTEKLSAVDSGSSGPLNRHVRHTRDQSAHLTEKPELLDRKLVQTLMDGNSKLESETLNKSYDYEAELVVENMQFSDKKIKQFLVKSEARTFLKECSDEHNVIICQHIDYGTVEKIKRIEFITMAPEKGIKYRCSWETMDQKKMILAVDGGIENSIGVVSRAVSVVIGHPKRNKEPVSLLRKMDHGIVVKVRVPNYYNGKYQEKKQLMDTLTRLFEVLEEANVEHVILPLDAVHDWPSTDFISCVITQTVQALLFKQISEKLYSVLLSLNDESLYEPAFQRTCKCVNKCVADKKAKRNRLKVVVVKGELDKIKADVIVNTTSRDLNLSNGKVSETLLKAAGSHLQRECSERYPNGITRLEIAVTDGYKLCCANVFHIALDRYHSQHEMDSIETIRCLMMKCFKTASEHGHKTIAFPAIGTGILKYPSDLVAAAMFESAERFKFDYQDTSLEQIFFVIYPSDVRVLKDFKKNEETLGKHLEEQRNRWYDIQLKITGTSENVRRAKSDILERGQDEIANTSEVCVEYSDVTLQDYVALCELHKKDIKAIKANRIHISHQQNKLTLTGKRKTLKKVSKQIGKYLKDVNKYRCVSLSVKCYEHHVIESMVEQENKKISSKDLICIFDKYYEIIRIFTKSASMEKTVMKSLTDKLKRGPDVHSVSIKTSETVHFDGKALEASSSDSADFYKRERNAVSLLDEHKRKHLFDKNMNVEEERKDKIESLDVLGSHHSETEERGVNAYDQHLMRKKYSQDERVFNTNDILVLVYTGDILCSDVDCIVSPANRDLNHCGGLASAIAKAAGDGLIKHCEYFVKDGPLSVSTVVSTPSGQLKYKCILQAVGPCWSDYRPITEKSLKQCQDDLRQTVINCLKKADESGMNLIALPTISSGLFGVPKELCAIEYAKAILEFGGKTQSLSEIHLVDTDPDKIKLIQEIFTMMINHGKPLMINMKKYIEASALKDESVPHLEKFKYTGRDKPKQLDLRNEPVSEGTDTDHFYLKENKMVCRFSSSHYLLIYEEDALQMQDIQAVVRCNNSSDGGKDEIPEKLSESGTKEYEADRSEYSKGKLDNSNVVTTDSGKKECEADRSEHSKGKLENSNVASTDSGKKEYEADRSEHSKGKLENSNAVTTDGGESNFKYTINVVTPKDDRAQHFMYIHVFDEVVKKGINCVAMPLLEIGGADCHDHKESVVVFLREWINFIHNCKSHPLTLHLVLNDKQTTDLVTDVVKDYFEEEARFEGYLGRQQKLGTHDERIQDISPDTTLQRTTDVEQDLDCVICLDKIHSPKKLKCGHQFCKDCIEGYFKVKPTCPVCGQICGVVTGDQPDGTMEIVKIKCSCAGYEKYKSIAVAYFFPSGYQKECNPRPGAYYRSISRTGYLPDNKEGREVCALMKVAFERRLTFTIGTSRTTLEEGVITWNDIHHKTDLRPHTQFGYPDETYLQRVREEMEVKGVTAEDIDKNFMKELEKERYSCKVSTLTSL